MSQVIYPIHIEFENWAAQMKNSVPHLNLPNPPAIAEWRFWAAQVVLTNNFPNIPAPTPHVFPKDTDWKKWAAYFISSIIQQGD